MERIPMVCVPNLERYDTAQGIGRVLTSLVHAWGSRVKMSAASYHASRLPVLRNVPTGIDMRAQPADIVLIPQLTGASALRGVRIPSLVIVHDLGVVDCPLDRAETDWLTHRAVLSSFRGLANANYLVTDSKFTLTRLQHFLPAAGTRGRVIPCGVPDAFLRAVGDRTIARQRLQDKYKIVLPDKLAIYVGTERARKNMPFLLQAMRRLLTVHANLGFVKIGGAGGDAQRASTKQLLQTLDFPTTPRFLLLDRVDDEELMDWYTVADVFVSASLYEGFGLPALEAMALGTPCVVVRAGAHEEIVGPAPLGRVVDCEESAFCSAVTDILIGEFPLGHRTQLRNYAGQYTWAKAAAAYESVFREMLAHQETTI